jgi:hypothetical protein
MNTRGRVLVAAAVLAAFLCRPPVAFGDETDNFTCRDRPLADAQAVVDQWMNERIAEAIGRANARGGGCDAACLFQQLERRAGVSAPHPLTWIPHARLARWIGDRPDIDRCRLKFRDSIYGARPYNQPWLFPFTGRIILLADSIRLSGRVVGIDKVNHFIREGLAHWRTVTRDRRDIAVVFERELGASRAWFRFTEHGLKGRSLTGVVAYADLAASYSGFTFWSELLSLGRPESYVVYDSAARRYTQTRVFTFADYVNDAWDEAINCSAFDPTLGRQVAAALGRRSVSCPAGDWQSLAALPHAELYVNPALRAISTR